MNCIRLPLPVEAAVFCYGGNHQILIKYTYLWYK